MMAAVGKYILSVITAAILCGVVQTIAGKKGTTGSILALMAGIVMILTVLSPWAKIRLSDFSLELGDISAQSDNMIASGEKAALDAYRAIIKERTEAYILNKADSFGAELQVSVSLKEGSQPIPEAVTISGNISPYAKRVLSDMIQKDLGIGLEEQIWTE